MELTKQMEWWTSSNGRKYTIRNMVADIFDPYEIDRRYLDKFGVSRTQMNLEALEHIDRESHVLEVGTNIGDQLILLQQMGFKNLHGIEIQEHAVEIARQRSGAINFAIGSLLEIPFPDESFDIVFTSGVLIHIAPEDISRAMAEIFRVSRKYIWGFEYYSDKYETIMYHGDKDMLWKTDYCKAYQTMFPELKVSKNKQYTYLKDNNIDCMFLLEKM